jgi:2-polyprenyl-3-methyl-5-hydroxy-6-metoxy-1,4-benzoquinol methylase
MPDKPWFENQDFENRITGLDLLGDVHAKTILDLGCAEGRISEHLVSKGARSAIGYDISPLRVSAPTIEQVKLFQADLNYPERLPDHPKFDIVLLMAVLRQLKNPLKLLTYAAAMTKVKGYLVVRTPVKDRGMFTGAAGISRFLTEHRFKEIQKCKAVNDEGQVAFIGIYLKRIEHFGN